jgi:hypothetical protein
MLKEGDDFSGIVQEEDQSHFTMGVVDQVESSVGDHF